MVNTISNKEIYDLLQTVLKKSDNIENQIKTNKEQLMQEIRTNNAEIKKELEGLKRENIELKKENIILKDRILFTERKIKKFNLIIYGIKEEVNREKEISFLISLINEKFNINIHYTDIRDYYRIGKKIEGKTRPVNIELISYQLKQEILINSKKLRGTGVSVSNDYTIEEYEQRKVLYANLKIARTNSIPAYIKNNVLFINEEKYTYERLKNNPIKIVDEREEIKEQEETSIGKFDVDQNSKQHGTDIPSSTQSQTVNGEERENVIIQTRKRKEQPTETDNFIKRSNRLKK